jgi:hypothetical protein
MFYVKTDGTATPVVKPEYRRQFRRQAATICHFVTIAKHNKLEFLDDGFYNKSTLFWGLNNKPVDIDEPADLELANALVDGGLDK